MAIKKKNKSTANFSLRVYFTNI